MQGEDVPPPWEAGRFLIATSTAQRCETVDGWTYRGLGLHVCPEAPEITVITHINSGFALRFVVAPLLAVVDLATAFAECSDAWEAMMVPSDWRQHDPELQNEVETISDACGFTMVLSASEGTDAIARDLHRARAAKRHLS